MGPALFLVGLVTISTDADGETSTQGFLAFFILPGHTQNLLALAKVPLGLHVVKFLLLQLGREVPSLDIQCPSEVVLVFTEVLQELT